MEIEKYNASSLTRGKMTNDSFETHMLSEDYSDNNKTYTIAEFVEMLSKGTWKGGNVDGLGHVREGEFVKSSEESEYGSDMLTFVHGSSVNGDNLEEYMSSIFSFMNPPYSNGDPDIGNGGGDSGNEGDTDTPDNPTNSKMFYRHSSYEAYGYRIDVQTCIMFDCAMLYFYLTYKGIAKKGMKIECIANGPSGSMSDRILFTENSNGYVNYQEHPIGNCALHLYNGAMDWSVSMSIRNDHTHTTFHII